MYRFFFSASVVFWIFKSIQIQPNPISDHCGSSWSNRMSWGARQLGCNFDRAGWDLSWKMCLDLGLRIDMKPYDPYGTSKRLGKMSFQFDIFELLTSRHFLNWNMWNFWCSSRIQIGTQHWLTADQVSEGEEALEWQQLSCKAQHQIRGPLKPWHHDARTTGAASSSFTLHMLGMGWDAGSGLHSWGPWAAKDCSKVPGFCWILQTSTTSRSPLRLRWAPCCLEIARIYSCTVLRSGGGAVWQDWKLSLACTHHSWRGLESCSTGMVNGWIQLGKTKRATNCTTNSKSRKQDQRRSWSGRLPGYLNVL